jgi:ferric-dicitrate binding protein FerR (iron transport regulator)
MTNDPFYNRLRELGWRGKLTATDEEELRAWLSANSEAQSEWQIEARLSEALGRLPDVPVATNFTARVLQAVELEGAAAERAQSARGPKWHWPRRWLSRAALAAVVLGVGLFSFHEVRIARRAELAESVTAVSEVSSLPSPEILKDFEAIRALNQAPSADEELLALLQ